MEQQLQIVITFYLQPQSHTKVEESPHTDFRRTLKKREMTNIALKSQEIWSICKESTNARPNIFTPNTERRQHRSPFIAGSFLSPVV